MTKAEQARDLKREHPDWGASRIAGEVGCSQENVSQALTRAGLPTRLPSKVPPCAQCGNKLSHRSLSGFCRVCRKASTRSVRPCNECGHMISRLQSLWRGHQEGGYKKVGPQYKGRAFCNRFCSGRWLGKHAGWGRKRLPETPMLQALGLGQTLRIKCRWQPHHGKGCQGRSWALRAIRGQAARISLRCIKNWCHITKLPLDKARQPVLKSELAELCPPEKKEPQA